MFQASDATRLTGLTRNQLREWCGSGRRGILEPDVSPAGPGRHAMYAWQTLLTLRLLLVLHARFGVEIGQLADVAKTLRIRLKGTSFPALWPLRAAMVDSQTIELTTHPEDVIADGGIVLPLRPHLEVLATAMSLPVDEQLPLLPPMAVSR
ncbi:MAG: hypothetical protein BGP25_10315 [Lysobacterales bacterium 63-13]|nr:MAG: hypothetical protein BGP25_10315 [Xanthomonadales bacterium 63-13]